MKIILYSLLFVVGLSNILFEVEEGLSIKSIVPILVAIVIILFSSKNILQLIKNKT